VKTIFREYIPKILNILIFLSGLMDVFSSFYAREIVRLEFLQDLFPLQVAFVSRTLTIIAGLSLMYLARGIWLRKRRSFVIVLCILLMSAIFHLVKGADYEEALISLVLAFAFLIFRASFFILSGTLQIWQRIRTVVVIFLFLLVYVVLGYYLLKDDFYDTVTIPRVMGSFLFNAFGIGHETLQAMGRFGRWFHHSITGVSLASYAFILTALFAPKKFLSPFRKKHEDFLKQTVSAEGKNSLSIFTLMDDKQYFLSEDDKSFVAYKVSADSAIVLGDPVGPSLQLAVRVKEFEERMNQYGFQVGFAYVSSESVKIYEQLGYKKLHLGDEAVLLLDSFQLVGSDMKDVRNAYNKLQRTGIKTEWFPFASIPDTIRQKVDGLHKVWKKTKGRLNLSFSMDFYPLPTMLPGYLQIVTSATGELLAALSYLPFGGENMILDLFTRSADSPNGTMETAIVEATHFFKTKALKKLNLGLVGLSTLSGEEQTVFSQSAKVLIQKVLKVYNYESLLRFKKKFSPQWEPKYFMYQKDANMAKLLTALLAVHIKK
jgi:phosphatidylglycerol lysyltransferase